MSHLSPERIAALADDTPTPIEAAHVTTCDVCTAELNAQRRLARMAAAASNAYGPPSSRFDALAPRLRAEGLITAPDRGVVVRRWTLRVAAAVGFMVVGAAAGRWTATGNLAALGGASGGDATVAHAASFKSADEAMQRMAAAQETYQNAAAYLAAQDTTQHFVGLNSDAYRTRLAALDDMAAASRAALYRAPQDPLLNQYYLAFQTAREQTLRQLAVSLPASRPLGRY
ncbi:MAG TPA: hypothetical protein VG916_11840 [Gemmatimonadaceae bacterium]|nr:hypothetical protein [Gemmatimonadaceae bacterium]